MNKLILSAGVVVLIGSLAQAAPPQIPMGTGGIRPTVINGGFVTPATTSNFRPNIGIPPIGRDPRTWSPYPIYPRYWPNGYPPYDYYLLNPYWRDQYYPYPYPYPTPYVNPYPDYFGAQR